MAVPVSLPQSQRPSRRKTAPPETDGLLKDLGRRTLSGLAMAGNVLDLPGSMVRDVIAGENPFDQWASPLTGQDRVSGRDVLERLGILGKNRKGFDAGDVAGFVGEVALDPLTYLGGVGLLKSLGKGGSVLSKVTPAIKKMGRVQRMTTTVGDVAKQVAPDVLERAVKGSKYADTAAFLAKHGSEPVGGLLSLHKGPLGGPVKALGTGKLAQKIGGALDVAGHAARYNPLSRVGAAMFSRPARGALTETGQQLANVATEGERAAEVAARETFAPQLRAFEEYLQTLPDMQSRFGAHAALLDAIEGVRPLPASMAHLQPVVDVVSKSNAEVLASDAASALRTADLDDDWINYNMRRAVTFPGDTSRSEFPSRLLSAKHGSQISRKAILRDIAGGTGVINRLTIDPRFSGIAHKMTPGQLADKAFWDAKERELNAAFAELGFPNWMYEHTRALARWLADLDPRHVELQVPKFAHNPVEMALRRKEMSGRAQAMAQTIIDAIGQPGRHFTRDSAPVNAVSAAEVFEAAGMDPQKALDLLQEKWGATSNVLRESQAAHTGYARGAADYSGVAQREAGELEQAMADMIGPYAITESAKRLLKYAEKKGVPLKVTPKMRKALKESGFTDDVIDANSPEDLVRMLKDKWDTAQQIAESPEYQELAKQYQHRMESATVARGLAGAANEVRRGVQQYLNDVYVPRELADDLGRIIKTFRNPDEVGVIIKAIDKFTALFKVGVLTWPARYTRDLTSGQIQNFLTGMWSWKDMNDADRLIRGRGPIKGLQQLGGKYANLSDEAATREFANEVFAHDVASTSQGITSEAGVAGTELSRSIATDIPGVQPLRFRKIAKKAIPKSLEQANFLNVAGVRGTETRFAPAAAGHDLGRYTDSNIRITGYLNLRRKGFAPQQAAEKVRLAQVDYKNLSATEQAVFRRLAPFYAFSRGMAEFLVRELADRPGGGVGQSIRAMNAGRSEEPMPEYVAQTAAISLGQLPSGEQRFLTGLGLMHEDPLALLTARGGVPDVSDTLAEIGSRLNPLAKYPIEAATGESLFQRGPLGGRDLLDQDPTIGRLISNVGEMAGAPPRTLPSGRAKPFLSHGFEQLAANLPTSRMMTTLRTLTDKRKLEGGPFPGSAALANVLTGVKLSDISPAASDAMLRDEADALMRQLGAQSYNVTRFTKSQIAQATPDERERMLAYNAVKDELAARSKARKVQRERSRSAR